MGQVLFRDYQKDEAVTIIREMVDTLTSRMRNEDKMCNTVSLYIGYSKHLGGFARRATLLSATDDSKVILDAVLEIYHRYIGDYPIRNIGIYYGGLVPSSHQQLSLFEDDEKQIARRNLQKAVDKLHSKYGNNSVLRASSLLEESTIKGRNEYIGGHRK